MNLLQLHQPQLRLLLPLPLLSVRPSIIQNLEICAALRLMESHGLWEKMWLWRWDMQNLEVQYRKELK